MNFSIPNSGEIKREIDIIIMPFLINAMQLLSLLHNSEGHCEEKCPIITILLGQIFVSIVYMANDLSTPM